MGPLYRDHLKPQNGPKNSLFLNFMIKSDDLGGVAFSTLRLGNKGHPNIYVCVCFMCVCFISLTFPFSRKIKTWLVYSKINLLKHFS